ncbi:MAG: hypothetical protein IJD43_13870, partial [Thermoguttaceae bacterium]|nr:hypothetical protein [Thermoguttaceae bacterium]
FGSRFRLRAVHALHFSARDSVWDGSRSPLFGSRFRLRAVHALRFLVRDSVWAVHAPSFSARDSV